MKKSKLLNGNLQVERLSNGRRKLLREFQIDIPEYGIKLSIPLGFETDYSSIPQSMAWIVHWSKVDIAGVVHDYCYKYKVVSRRTADKVWRNVALSGEHHANQFQAWMCYKALRAGGWYAWKRKGIK